MFDTLTQRFENVFSRLRGRGRLTDSDINEASTEIRHALLEADVNLKVVDSFIERVRTRCAGTEISASLTPGQQVVKIVNEELQATLGNEPLTLAYADAPPTVILLAGLQGSGKTTAAAKLAQWFKSQGRNPLLVGADLQRPAAVEQLRVLAARIDVPVWSADGLGSSDSSAKTANAPEQPSPVTTAAAGLAKARQLGKDVLIVDTAGRLVVDTELMTEVAHVSDAVSPDYTFFVLDAMTGQDAVNTASAFHTTLEVDAVILTKLDGDARGGAALSVGEVLGRPIAFASVGEALDEFEQFHPDRMATRILGMGDVTTLIEKAEQVYEAEEAAASTQRLMDGSFTLDDFVEQLRQVRKMGNLKGLVSLMPGVPAEVKDADLDDGRLNQAEAIVLSMTPSERALPDLIDTSRRARIAAGSGTSTTQVSNLLRQFSQMKKMMSSMGGMAGFGGKAGRAGKGTGSKKRAKAARKPANKKPNKNQAKNRGTPSRTTSRTSSRTGGSGKTAAANTPGSASQTKSEKEILADLDLQLPDGFKLPSDL